MKEYFTRKTTYEQGKWTKWERKEGGGNYERMSEHARKSKVKKNWNRKKKFSISNSV